MEGIPAMAAKTEGGARPKRRSRSKATSAGTAERPAPRARLPREPDPLKQAVVVIHGMGEQAPMATLRSFVRAIWETDLSLTRKAPDKDKVRRMDGGETVNRAWIVPDTRTGSLELSRIATPAGDFGARTDFFEFYWADIMAGTTFEHVKAWVSGLLLRWPHQVPTGMRRAWVILWLLVILTAGTAAMGIFGLTSGEDQAPPDAAWIALSRLIGFGIVTAVAIVAMVGLQIRLARAPRRPAVSWAFTVVVPLAFILIVAYLSIFIPRSHFEAIVTIQVTALLSAVALYLSLPQLDSDTATLSDRLFVFDYMMVSLMIAISIMRVNPHIASRKWLTGALDLIHVAAIPALVALAGFYVYRLSAALP